MGHGFEIWAARPGETVKDVVGLDRPLVVSLLVNAMDLFSSKLARVKLAAARIVLPAFWDRLK